MYNFCGEWESKAHEPINHTNFNDHINQSANIQGHLKHTLSSSVNVPKSRLARHD